jgi:hypothetical protein
VHSEPDKDEALNEVLLCEPGCVQRIFPYAPPPQKAVLFCPVSSQVHHLKWWLTKLFVDHLDIFYMFAEMGNDVPTEMQLKFLESSNPSVFVQSRTLGEEAAGLGMPASRYSHQETTHLHNNQPLN